MEKSAGAFRTISEVSLELDVPQHVLRFWEQKFTQIKPLKRGGGRRYYRPADVELIRAIRRLLYAEGYTIRGVQRLLKTQGGRVVGLTLEAISLDALDGSESPTEGGIEGAERPVDGSDGPDDLLLAELRRCKALLDAALGAVCGGEPRKADGVAPSSIL